MAHHTIKQGYSRLAERLNRFPQGAPPSELLFDILKILVHGKLFFTFFIMQIGVGVVIPLSVLGYFQFVKTKEKIRRTLYLITSICVLIGIFYMRWNVVIGGQLFSKSFYGFTSYKVDLVAGPDFWYSLLWFVVPFGILAFLLWLLPPWKKSEEIPTK